MYHIMYHIEGMTIYVLSLYYTVVLYIVLYYIQYLYSMYYHTSVIVILYNTGVLLLGITLYVTHICSTYRVSLCHETPTLYPKYSKRPLPSTRTTGEILYPLPYVV